MIILIEEDDDGSLRFLVRRREGPAHGSRLLEEEHSRRFKAPSVEEQDEILHDGALQSLEIAEAGHFREHDEQHACSGAYRHP